jgi:hypothetical protein
MALFRLVADLTLNNSGFMAGMKQAESGATALGNKLATVFGTAAVIAYAQHVVSLVGDIKDLAEQFEITNEQVQILQKTAAESGNQFEQYGQILLKIKKAQADLKSGDAGASTLFKRLGIDPDQSAYEILKQLGSVRDLSAVFDLTGVKAGKLITSLKELSTLTPMELLSDDEINKMDEADRLLISMKKSLASLFAKTLGSDLKQIQDIIDFFKNPGKGNKLFKFLTGETIGGPEHTPTMGKKRMAEEESMFAGFEWAADKEFVNGQWVTKKKAEKTKAAKTKAFEGFQFQGLPTDALSRIGGGFGANSGLGAIEREMLSLTKRMSDDLLRIRQTADAAANGKATE